MRKLTLEEQENTKGGFIFLLFLALLPVLLDIGNAIAGTVAQNKLETAAAEKSKEAADKAAKEKEHMSQDTFFLSM